ncbi:hypothetical protein GCM10011494_03020 [Novosphingobium endophyticum]|uniref:Uncharacterized protein n=1 Tax=Novosphingobium endophyticum TaxID=1955250 RepID=A0A916TPP7_9SPHN|nr:hypothetical protein [Novosphingobium endophyticum]GGB88112.1 hypothetical protein GCM10011494_03020 [Novosphingobium endophyticum]
MDGDDQERALIRRVAEVEFSNSLALQARLLDENGATFRWLLASLLAVNGGSAVAILTAEKISGKAMILGGGAFSIGVFFALLLAFFTMKSTERMVAPLGTLSGFWLAAIESGDIDLKALAKAKLKMQKQLKPTKCASNFCGWASAMFFIAGVVAIGFNLK